MRILEQTETRMVLAGTPGGRGWMAFAVVLGAALTVAAGAAAVAEARAGAWASLAAIGVGALVAQAIFWMGAVTLAVGRERLELDRASGRGRYLVVSPIVETGSKPVDFDLAAVDSVSFELRVERSGHARAGGREVEVWRARLRLARPRRAIVLAESGGDGHGVRALAEAVARFLGVDLADATGADQPEERRAAARLDAPLVRDAMRALDLEPPPFPNLWRLVVDPDAERVTLTSEKRGGPPVAGCFLAVATLIWLAAGAIGVGAWVPDQTFNGEPISTPTRVALTLPAIALGVAVLGAWASLLFGRREVIVTPDAVTTRWLFPARGAVAAIPGLSRLARGASVPTPEIESVKTVSGSDGRAVELRTDRARVRIAPRSLDAEAEEAEAKWLGATLRTAVRAMGGD